jgi:AraC-like DNA-binding protein
VYNAAKLHAALSTLETYQIDTQHVLEGTGLGPDDIRNDDLRVSSQQILRAFKNISERDWDRFLPYRIGRSVHLSAYGLYGYALLCSTCYRETIAFAKKYHHLAAPTVEMEFAFEDDAEGWDIEPVATDHIDHKFYAFLLCMQMGIMESLHRDVMGPGFLSDLIELRITDQIFYQLPDSAARRIQLGAGRNRFHVTVDWIDRKLELGNDLTFKQIVQICDTELSELVMQDGVAGQVRKVLLETAAFSSNMDAIARHMGMTSRTLRRHLKQESTTFSEIVDTTRVDLALRYLRAAELSTEEIAYVLGFSETASFVRAFKRWTGKSPRAYRMGFAA